MLEIIVIGIALVGYIIYLTSNKEEKVRKSIPKSSGGYGEYNPSTSTSPVPNNYSEKLAVTGAGEVDQAEFSQEVRQPFSVNARLMIDYTKANGIKTTREVDIKDFVAGMYGNLITGHCFLRNDRRSFRVDRISKCIDVETGEVVENVYDHLWRKYQESPEYQRDKFSTDEYKLLQVLSFIEKLTVNHVQSSQAARAITYRT